MKHKKQLHGKRKPSQALKPHHPSKITKSKPARHPPNKHHGGGGGSGGTPSKPKPSSTAATSRPIIPFTPTSTLLLIGEGDFSFTNSLVTSTPPHISPSTVITTTTNDSETLMYEKYPHASETVSSLKELGHRVIFNVDVTSKRLPKPLTSQKYTCVIFNFPHVGGLSTHVDRQIRSNQELILSFLKSCVPLLSPTGGMDDGGGNIVITLFDGKPYDDWNVKELAKSVGLECVRSFKFDAKVYEGYRHVRTIGVREREGDWRGEERGARSFVFAVRADKKRKKPKIKKGDDGKKGKEESSDDDDN